MIILMAEEREWCLNRNRSLRQLKQYQQGLEKPPRVILMCPQGERFTQKKAEELSAEEHLVFICGHYEGYDERIREHLVTDELSIGDFVLNGRRNCCDGCDR